MLYTLSVFITEPISWVEKYEWREMTDTEKNALGTHCEWTVSLSALAMGKSHFVDVNFSAKLH